VLQRSIEPSQYTAIVFSAALADAGIAPSIGSVGDALDNALMESNIGLYKTELIERHPRTWTGAGQVECETASWVHWFNTARIHNSIGRVPPNEFEDNYRETTTATTGEVA
jgi:putative transposase